MGDTWYLRSPNASAGAAVGTYVFRQAITVAGTAPISAYLRGATDDVLSSIAVNGVNQPGNSGWGFGGVVNSTTFTLLPDVNVIEAQVTNGSGPAGMAIEVRKGDGTLLSPISAWKYSP